MDSRTVGKRIASAGLKPSAKGYRTAEVVRAIFGDYEGERLRKIREEADGLAIKNAKERGHLIEAEDVKKKWMDECALIKQRLLTIPVKIEGRFGPEVGGEVDREVRDALTELSGKES